MKKTRTTPKGVLEILSDVKKEVKQYTSGFNYSQKDILRTFRLVRNGRRSGVDWGKTTQYNLKGQRTTPFHSFCRVKDIGDYTLIFKSN